MGCQNNSNVQNQQDEMDKLAKQEADKAKLLGEKSMEEQIQHWQNIINKKWVNKNAHDKIGMLYYYKGNHRKAEQHLQLSIDQGNPSPHFQELGDLLLKRNKYSEALQFFMRDYESNQFNSKSAYKIAQTYLLMKQINKSLQYSQIAISDSHDRIAQAMIQQQIQQYIQEVIQES